MGLGLEIPAGMHRVITPCSASSMPRGQLAGCAPVTRPPWVRRASWLGGRCHPPNHSTRCTHLEPRPKAAPSPSTAGSMGLVVGTGLVPGFFLLPPLSCSCRCLADVGPRGGPCDR